MRYSRILGITQGDPNYILGEFISFTVDGEGHIYVLGWREKTVRKFDRRIFLDDRLPEDISTWHSMDESFRNQIKEGIKFPETMPAFLSFIPMDSSCLMVVRSGDYGQNALIDIFDPSGRFIIGKKLSFSLNLIPVFYPIADDFQIPCVFI